MFSHTCLHAIEASILKHPFVNFSSVQDQSMLYLKEKGFIQVLEMAVTAILGYVRMVYEPS